MHTFSVKASIQNFFGSTIKSLPCREVRRWYGCCTWLIFAHIDSHCLTLLCYLSKCKLLLRKPSFCLTETGQIDPVIIEKYNTPGFVGCLSRVQFNRIAPLKAALRSGISSTASVQGVLVESNCGASPLTISPMSAAFDPWHPDSGEWIVMMTIIRAYVCGYFIVSIPYYFKLYW